MVFTSEAIKPERKNQNMKTTIKTTAKYPLTRIDCVKQIESSVEKFGPNQARASFGYRKNGVPGTGGGTIAYSFVESSRTPGAFREIGFAS